MQSTATEIKDKTWESMFGWCKYLEQVRRGHLLMEVIPLNSDNNDTLTLLPSLSLCLFPPFHPPSSFTPFPFGNLSFSHFLRWEGLPPSAPQRRRHRRGRLLAASREAPRSKTRLRAAVSNGVEERQLCDDD